MLLIRLFIRITSEKSLEEILSNSDRSLTVLDLSECGIKQFPEEVLEFVNLEEIDLSKNEIREFPIYLLKGLKNLKRLYLSNNKIECILTKKYGIAKTCQLCEEIVKNSDDYENSPEIQNNRITDGNLIDNRIAGDNLINNRITDDSLINNRIADNGLINNRIADDSLINNRITDDSNKTTNDVTKMFDVFKACSENCSIYDRPTDYHLDEFCIFVDLNDENPLPLEILDLSNNRITELPSMSHFKSLKTLLLYENSLKNLSGVECLSNLEELSVFKNELIDASAVGELESLLELNLSYNHLDMIPSMKKLKYIKKVCISNNNLIDVSGMYRISNNSSILDNSVYGASNNNTNMYEMTNSSYESKNAADISNESNLTKTTSYESKDDIGVSQSNLNILAHDNNLNKNITDDERGEADTRIAIPNDESCIYRWFDLFMNKFRNVFYRTSNFKLSRYENDSTISFYNPLNNPPTISFFVESEITAGTMHFLEFLDLSYNKIVSVERLGNLPSLEVLNLYSNQLKSIPKEVGDFQNLIRLNLGKNQLQSIPNEIGNLTGLKIIDLSFNKLVNLPKSMENLPVKLKINITGNLNFEDFGEGYSLGKTQLRRTFISGNVIMDD